VRPFSVLCGEKSIRVGHLPFRAEQLPVCAAKNPFVRTNFDLRGKIRGFSRFYLA